MRPLLYLLLLFALACHGGVIEGRVVAIADGDTITVLDVDRVQHRIRLGGIDESEKQQAFGTRSKEASVTTNKHLHGAQRSDFTQFAAVVGRNQDAALVRSGETPALSSCNVLLDLHLETA